MSKYNALFYNFSGFKSAQVDFFPPNDFIDLAIVLEARNLKTQFNKVHIWTKDESLKTFEPDTEYNPFVKFI